MVSGGPYGLEDVVQMSGYLGAILILILTPLLWSVPTALMVAELASAIPQEGGFYIWVRRGLGTFFGYQEVWLTLAGSIFEMALYPTLFVDYLGHFAPWLVAGHRAAALGLAMIVICTLWNIRGARSVGMGALWMFVLLLGPFVILATYGFSHRGAASPAPTPLTHADYLGGILVAMWNYMGWDNTSTIAEEVERPQRTYPLAMLLSVALVVISYVIPVAAAAYGGLAPSGWVTGGWVDVGRKLGGEWLAIALMIGGIISAFGTFNALMLSFSRLPLVMAEDGYLPKIFALRHPKSGAPWVAIAACAAAWAGCMFLGFERLVILDVLLTGLSILLEFWALTALRIREPSLSRPYRVPGGTLGTVLLGIPPLALMIVAVVRNHSESMGSVSALTVGLSLVAAGPMLYFLSRLVNRSARRPMQN